MKGVTPVMEYDTGKDTAILTLAGKLDKASLALK